MSDAIHAAILLGHVEIRSWLEHRPDGSFVGMGERTEFDHAGNVISRHVEPTGIALVPSAS